MRFNALTLVVTVAILGACGGGDSTQTTTTVKKDSTALSATTATPAATPAATTPSAPVAPASGTPTTSPAKAVSGKTVQVKMIGDDKGYRFEPANLTVKAGDAIKFTNVSGGPHNVAFDPAAVPGDVKSQLSANMPNQMGDLSGPLLVIPNDAYTISFAGVKAGKYDYHCTPHLAMGMKGTITVQ
ncbi:MAG: hypothetical protein NVS4B3_20650 [Gemmatimonadaceae bacterium]